MSVICRTCSYTRIEVVNLFTHYNENSLLSQILNECTSVEVQIDDGLPSYICSKCKNSLISAWNFRRMTIKTDLNLRQNFCKEALVNMPQEDKIIIKDEYVKDETFNSVIIKDENICVSSVKDNELIIDNAISFPKNNETNIANIAVIAGNNNEHLKTCDDKDLGLKEQSCNISNNVQHAFENSTSNHNSKNCQSIDNSIISDQKIIDGLLEPEAQCVDNLSSIMTSQHNAVQTVAELKASNKSDNFIFKNQIVDLSTTKEEPINEIQTLNTSHALVEKVKPQNNYLAVLEIEDINANCDITVCKNNTLQKVVSIDPQFSISNNSLNKEILDNENQTVGNSAEKINSTSRSSDISNVLDTKVKFQNNHFIQKIKEDVQKGIVKQQEELSNDNVGNSDIFNNTKMKLVNLERKKIPNVNRKGASVYCELCNKSYKYSYYYKMHIRIHNGALPYKCKTCGKTFPIHSILKAHEVIHFDARPFQCDTCGKGCKTASALRLHKMGHVDGKPYKCNICSFSCKREGGLKVHMKRHENQRDHVCETCGKTFAIKGDLQIHSRTHSGIKKHICTECGKAFLHNSNLHDHIRCHHTDERQYTCTYCDKRFKTSSVLKKHLLIHTGEKPHLCKLCGKKFRQSVALSTHMRSHTGEEPYVCKLCSVKFKYRRLLNNHMKTHKQINVP